MNGSLRFNSKKQQHSDHRSYLLCVILVMYIVGYNTLIESTEHQWNKHKNPRQQQKPKSKDTKNEYEQVERFL